MKDNMIAYLEGMMKSFKWLQETYGNDDRMTIKAFDSMIACKEMTEALIGMPVNLQKDGRVTVG